MKQNTPSPYQIIAWLREADALLCGERSSGYPTGDFNYALKPGYVWHSVLQIDYV